MPLVKVSDPFFLVGFQRSGTTLLRLMLNAHPDIAIPHDSAELWLDYRSRLTSYNNLRDSKDARRLMKDLLREPRIGAWQTALPAEWLFADPTPSTFPEVMRRFYTVYAQAHGKHIWGDKNTGNLTELDQLNIMFPTCKIIHLIRDGRDCALSHLSKEYIYGYENILRAAVEWKEQVTLCHKMGAMLSLKRFYELCYEDLLADPERELSRLCAFLGVSFSSLMLNYHEQINKHVPEHRRSLWPLLNKPPVAANAFKWKSQMKAGDRAVFERIAGSLLHQFGYETMPTPVRGGRLRELWYDLHSRISWRFKKVPKSENSVSDQQLS
jgi:hypothetical protein